MKRYIIDLFSKIYYGPYHEKEEELIQKDMELVKYISDECLQEGTNVLLVPEETLLKSYSKYKYGSTYDLKKKINDLKSTKNK